MQENPASGITSTTNYGELFNNAICEQIDTLLKGILFVQENPASGVTSTTNYGELFNKAICERIDTLLNGADTTSEDKEALLKLAKNLGHEVKNSASASSSNSPPIPTFRP